MSTNTVENAGAAGGSTAGAGSAVLALSVAPTAPVAITGVVNARGSISFLSKSSDADLAVAINRIIAQMTGNATYPAPVPTLAVIAAARDTFVASVNALDRSRPATVRRNNARAALVQLVRDLMLYVQHQCAGDLGKLLSSGFPAQRSRQKRVGSPGTPENVRLLPGELSGQLLARCRKLPGARAYQWRYAAASAPTAWTLLDPVMTATTVLEGLARGTDYIAQVRAFGTRGAGDWSDAASLMAM